MLTWKKNWQEARQRILDWWDGKGFIVGSGLGVRLTRPYADLPTPEPASSLEQQWVDVPWRIQQSRRLAAWSGYPLETVPVVEPVLGPGSLALYLGCKPTWQERTVWFHPCISDPDACPPIRLNTANPWWQKQIQLVRGMIETAQGDYLVDMPDMIENWDVLASMRGSQELLMDMVERPGWVKERIDQITDAYFNAFDSIYALLRPQDGVCNHLRTWFPGKVAKIQCDGSAMFSPAMFREFVIPALVRQCEWLDRSLYHLDGSQSLCHLEALLEIDSLDAIEWTPDPKAPSAGSPYWYDLYRLVLRSGKRLQVLGAAPEEIPSLIDALGCDGIYFLSWFTTESESEQYERVVEKLRR